MTAAQIIREARLKADLTQTELAERLGRERAQVARWEIGGQEPSFENVVAVVEACGFQLELPDRRARRRSAPRRRVDDKRAAGAAAAGAGADRARRRPDVTDSRGPFDPYEIFSALEAERIAYVVVGAFARVVHGSGETTHGIDISPSLREEDLRRLARVLDELGGHGRDGEPIQAEQFAAEGRTEALTRAGGLAVVPTPWGTRGYDRLRIRANRENLGKSIRPPIASLADCVRMLEASTRAIDQERIQRIRRMMELERRLARTRHRGLGLER